MLRLVRQRHPALLVALMALLVTGLVDGGSLCYAVVVAAPEDVGAVWQIQDAFHGFPALCQQHVVRISVPGLTGS